VFTAALDIPDVSLLPIRPAPASDRAPEQLRPRVKVGGGASTSTKPRRPRALRPAASAVGARHVSGGASRACSPAGLGSASRSGLLPVLGCPRSTRRRRICQWQRQLLGD